mmetsp:Transcript_20027/g.33361  ORF Transcript_20027/g.33361 Transcript_20027/m.33361 type:complete len:140 (+) Transcript_20027:2473-2892(+)
MDMFLARHMPLQDRPSSRVLLLVSPRLLVHVTLQKKYSPVSQEKPPSPFDKTEPGSLQSVMYSATTTSPYARSSAATSMFPAMTNSDHRWTSYASLPSTSQSHHDRKLVYDRCSELATLSHAYSDKVSSSALHNLRDLV